MLCEQVFGTLHDIDTEGKTVEAVDIEWHEAFKKIHRKTTDKGHEVGIRMDDSVLTRGLRQDDVIYVDDSTVVVVNIPPCEAIRAEVRRDHPRQIAKLCYEVGNTHTTMFRGEDDFTFYIPYHEPMMDKLGKIHGVTVEKKIIRFDFDKSLSSTINNHHH